MTADHPGGIQPPPGPMTTTDPIDGAIQHVTTFLAAAEAVRCARRDDPSAFPVLGSDVSHEVWARRIVGELLDAGWTPPDLGRAGDG